MSTTDYVQCRMRQGDSETVGWIPERGAKLGARVELPELGGLWEVVHVGNRMDGLELKAKQRADRNSLPSIIGN